MDWNKIQGWVAIIGAITVLMTGSYYYGRVNEKLNHVAILEEKVEADVAVVKGDVNALQIDLASLESTTVSGFKHVDEQNKETKAQVNQVDLKLDRLIDDIYSRPVALKEDQ